MEPAAVVCEGASQPALFAAISAAFLVVAIVRALR